ncbi:MAG: protein-L-isoaspartate O-methyltransferase [Beggiatoa sp. IS2]|nr:MAG: protein-L-isoaspartate O-methyltransferase [Beggiatoa sp. IS2]
MLHLNFEQARFNMVEQQIRTWEVLDQQVLDLIMTVPREEFVPSTYRALAFADIQIPLSHDQVMMAPNLEGRLLQAVMLQPTDQVLEIGTGSGYLTALLAKASQHVDSVDIFDDFIHEAAIKLSKMNITNVSLQVENAINGFKSTGYDVIVLTGAVSSVARRLQVQLNQGGRLFAIVGKPPIMQAQLITRVGAQEWQMDSLFETLIPPLVGAIEPNRFIF